MLRTGTSKNVVLHGGFRQFAIVHVLQLIAGHRLMAVGDPQHLADAHCRLRVIAGDHFHADPCGLAGVNRINGLRTWRIHHPGDAEEHQALAQIVVGQRRAAGPRRFTGGGNHAQPLAGEARDLILPVLAIERRRALPGHLLAAHRENHIRGAGDQHALSGVDSLLRRHVLIL